MLVFLSLMPPCTPLVCLPIRSKGVSRLPLAHPMPDNGTNRAGIASPDPLGSLFSAGWGPPLPPASWRAEIFDKQKSAVEETLVPISRQNNRWSQGIKERKPNAVQFYESLFYVGVFFFFFYFSCIVLRVALSCWESQGEMLIQCFYIGETAC